MVVVFFVLVSVVAVVDVLVLVLVFTILVVFFTDGVLGVDGGDFLLPVLTGCSALLAGGILRASLDDGVDGAISTFS